MMKPIARIALVVLLVPALAGAEVVWRADDAQPIPEPAEDPEGDFIWWDGAYDMTVYQAGKVLDLGHLARSTGDRLGLVGPLEAANTNALDEVPDSTWFRNRHHLRRLSTEELARGPNRGPPLAPDGALRVRSGKALGASPGFLVEDASGNRFLLKFDPPEIPEMATGAELVSSRIVHALGWSVPEYDFFLLDARRLELAPDATTRDEYRRKVAMTQDDLQRILARGYRLPDGRYRCVASRLIAGVAKGPFRTLGVRPDDPNDRVPHEDRRELRGLRVVAAWIDYTDSRRGNFYDAFVRHPDDPGGKGHLSSTFASGNVVYKPPKYGHEYFVDPPTILASLFTLGLWVKPWEDPPPLRYPAVGRFDAKTFDPDEWRTSYPNPLFDQATSRDLFWGARLVASLTEDDLKTVIGAGEWSDPAAESALFDVLRERRDRILRTYFSTDRLSPLDRFVARPDSLEFEDLAVATGAVPAARAAYRYRLPGQAWKTATQPRVPLDGPAGAAAIELRSSHDGGDSWGPVVRITVADHDVVGIERETAD
jgi:hypothetical protein